MNKNIRYVKIGLFLVMLTLIFGVGLGIIFGIYEDEVKSYITEGVALHADVHDDKSNSKIWRYAQRSHFHATGIAAFSIGLILLVLVSSLKPKLKSISAILIGLGGLYPLSWFAMFILAPSLGRSAAHHHFITEIFSYIGVAGLLSGIVILCLNLFLDMFQDDGLNN
ncbi:MAG: hypothetical protein JKX75_08295 [Gammaproteobacteria bacterium]|nr:hypothetical protein [Gammaproteobacteria bacterium]